MHALQPPSHRLAIGRQTGDAFVGEAFAGVCQQADRLQGVVDDHRLENIQFQISAGAAEIDSDIIAEDLGANRLAITSLAFILVCVPLPVCQMTRGK